MLTREDRAALRREGIVVAKWRPGRTPERTLKVLDRMFPQLKLYCISTPGFYDPQYIVKAKGRYGDVLVQWQQTGKAATPRATA